MPGSYTVAIADDDADALYCLRYLIEKAGHKVVAEARSGEELVERCKSSSADLIVTDIKMRGMSGFAAAAKIMEVRELPVVIVSAYLDSELVEQANACRVFAYLIKPFRGEELAVAITLAVARFQEFQSLQREAADTRQALEDRKHIERAKGVLMKKCDLDEPGAFHRLQNLARSHRQKLVDVAKSILLADEVLDLC